MSEIRAEVGPAATLHEAASIMVAHKTGSAIVMDPEQPGPGIITERDIMKAIGDGLDADLELVADHLSSHPVFAEPDWSLEQATSAMIKGGFRHLIVVTHEPIGVVSMRDIVTCMIEIKQA